MPDENEIVVESVNVTEKPTKIFPEPAIYIKEEESQMDDDSYIEIDPNELTDLKLNEWKLRRPVWMSMTLFQKFATLIKT